MALSEKVTRLRPATVADLDDLAALARDDGHRLILPDHVFERDGRICGAAGLDLAGVALGVWFHTERMKAVGWVKMILAMEKHFVSGGKNWVAVPVGTSSPVAAIMPGLGYHNLGSVNLHLKRLA